MKKLNDKGREIFTIIPESLILENYKPLRGESKSNRRKQSKNFLKNCNLQGDGVKIIIPSNIIDIDTKLEVLLGLKISGHTDTLTDASNLIDDLYKNGDFQKNNNIEMLLTSFLPNKRDVPSKLLEQIVFNTISKTEEHVLIIMAKSTLEEHLSQPLQTNHKQFKIAVTFVSAYNGIFNVTISDIRFCFKKARIDEDFIQITITPGAYEIESLDDEIKNKIIHKGLYTEATYPFRIKPYFR